MKGILLMYKRMIFFKLNIFDNDSQDLAADMTSKTTIIFCYPIRSKLYAFITFNKPLCNN